MGQIIEGSFRSSADREREVFASSMPHRRGFDKPLDPKLESHVGRLFVSGKITPEEYTAAEKWRTVHLAYLRYIHEPDEFDDDSAEDIEEKYKRGRKILMDCGRRVFHAVSSITTYGDPEELGDVEFTVEAARRGFWALSQRF